MMGQRGVKSGRLSDEMFACDSDTLAPCNKNRASFLLFHPQNSLHQNPSQTHTNAKLIHPLNQVKQPQMSTSPNPISPIPLIDFHHFTPLTLVAACEEWGCLRLVNHDVPLSLMMEMKAVVRALLDLPYDVKIRNVDVIAGSGYMAPSAANPLYEALGLYDMASSKAVDEFCSQLDASPHQRDVIKNFAQAIHKLAMDLAQKLAEGMGLVGYEFAGWPSHFRINKYSFTPETVGTSGVQIHTDSGFLTVLQDDEDVEGLEVMDKCGTFIPVDPLRGSFVVNLGDIAKAWSNGRLCSVQHRVQCKEAKVRISIASFLLGPKDTMVEAPAELISSDNPRQYVPFTFEEYRKLRLKTKLQAGQALELVRAKS